MWNIAFPWHILCKINVLTSVRKISLPLLFPFFLILSYFVWATLSKKKNLIGHLISKVTALVCLFILPEKKVYYFTSHLFQLKIYITENNIRREQNLQKINCTGIVRPYFLFLTEYSHQDTLFFNYFTFKWQKSKNQWRWTYFCRHAQTQSNCTGRTIYII